MRRRPFIVIAGLVGLVVVVNLVAWIRSWNQPGPASENLISPLVDDGFSVVLPFTGEIRDTNSLEQLHEAILARGRDALAHLDAQISEAQISLERSPQPGEEELVRQSRLKYNRATVLIYEGRFDEAVAAFQELVTTVRSSGIAHRFGDFETQMHGVLGVISLRQGEVDNCLACLGPSSCIFPIVPQAVHKNADGSRAAIHHFTEYLRARPDDLRVHWLLNIAYMTLGEYPQKVPSQ